MSGPGAWSIDARLSEESASTWQIALGVGSYPSIERDKTQPSREAIEIDLGATPGRESCKIRNRRKQSAEQKKAS
jgi:hypothetical protein